MSIDLAAIQAKLAAPAGWGCDKECGRDEVKALLATTVALRDALRAMIALIPQKADWCDNPDYPILQMGACGTCASCLAWQAAQDALKTCEEVGDGTE